jgi:Flp pilus assembly pilin Flp
VRNESGQAALEYALLVAVVSLSMIVLLLGVGDWAAEAIETGIGGLGG